MDELTALQYRLEMAQSARAMVLRAAQRHEVGSLRHRQIMRQVLIWDKEIERLAAAVEGGGTDE